MTQANESTWKLTDLDVIGFTEVPDPTIVMPRGIFKIYGVPNHQYNLMIAVTLSEW